MIDESLIEDVLTAVFDTLLYIFAAIGIFVSVCFVLLGRS
jgi:hypothetical protein